ncbi:MAG: N-6 DNA methylase [Euryarchaeota archaeon]
MTINPINGTEDDWKAFGQFFTPRHLSLIAAAAVLRNQCSRLEILDPSCGEGHMLAAVNEVASIKGIDIHLTGVELDPLHSNIAKKFAHVVKTGDAFNIITGNQPGWNPEQYHGIVANPPYIRLDGQSQSNERLTNISTDADDPFEPYRDALSHHHSDDDEWSKLVSEIGGRADISLAFWFLSVLNLKPGHRLAIITSDAWRTRDYGLIQRTLIQLNLDIEIIIKQPKNMWFPETQVSSSLVIARKISEDKKRTDEPLRLIHIDESFNISTEEGLGRICQELEISADNCGQKAIDFIDFLHQVDLSLPGIMNVHKLERMDIIRGLSSDLALKNGDAESLINLLREFWPGNTQIYPPAEMLSSMDIKSRSFEALRNHLTFNQGLRTGCDKAYYCSVDTSQKYSSLSEDDEVEVVFPEPMDITLKIPKRYVKLCVKGQDEESSTSQKAVIVPGKAATSKDFMMMQRTYPAKIPDWEGKGLHLMSPNLEKWVVKVEQTNFGTETKPKRILDFSVQRDNAKNKVGLAQKPQDKIKSNDFPSWWYTLNLKSRHVPAMYFPRINDSELEGGMRTSNDPGGLVVSANFTTIGASEGIDPSTIIRLFDSEWISTHLEISCAPMGGGALKIESANFQRIVMPKINLSRQYKSTKEVDEAFAKSLGMEYDIYKNQLQLLRNSFKSLRE